ncbi:uncharacterized protein RSE6_08275 [Rhynchosporium secalis]|uniref:Uncharacterized protein n=1 Tax=Rhynchosporium secalis TaxID=38038 RepID=A0A1E1MF88_RHYSE|nr:uncharacterized protein RSE6_08275 [Rhynchosporium secalis]
MSPNQRSRGSTVTWVGQLTDLKGIDECICHRFEEIIFISEIGLLRWAPYIHPFDRWPNRTDDDIRFEYTLDLDLPHLKHCRAGLNKGRKAAAIEGSTVYGMTLVLRELLKKQL